MGFLRNMLATHHFDTSDACVMCGTSRELLIHQNELGVDISCHGDDNQYLTEDELQNIVDARRAEIECDWEIARSGGQHV